MSQFSCHICGKFCSYYSYTELVYSGGYYPEPSHEEFTCYKCLPLEKAVKHPGINFKQYIRVYISYLNNIHKEVMTK